MGTGCGILDALDACLRESRLDATAGHVTPVVAVDEQQRIGSSSTTFCAAGEGERFLSPVPAGSRLHSRSPLAAVEATRKGTPVVREIAVHVVGNDKPALLYSMILLYQPPAFVAAAGSCRCRRR